MSVQQIKGLRIDWDKIGPDSYLREIKAIYGVEALSFDHAVTFFVGENGSGKSTLLEAMAVAAGSGSKPGTEIVIQ